MLRLLGIKGTPLPLRYLNENLRRLSKELAGKQIPNQNLTPLFSQTTHQTPSFDKLQKFVPKISVMSISSSIPKTSALKVPPFNNQTSINFPEKQKNSFYKTEVNKNSTRNLIKNLNLIKEENTITNSISNLKLNKKGLKLLKTLESVLLRESASSNTKIESLTISDFNSELQLRTSFDTSNLLIHVLTLIQSMSASPEASTSSKLNLNQNKNLTFENFHAREKSLNQFFYSKIFQNIDSKIDCTSQVSSSSDLSKTSKLTNDLLLDSIYLATSIKNKAEALIDHTKASMKFYEKSKVKFVLNTRDNLPVYFLIFNALKLNNPSLLSYILKHHTNPSNTLHKYLTVNLTKLFISSVSLDSPENVDISDFKDIYGKLLFCFISKNLPSNIKTEMFNSLLSTEDIIWYLLIFYSQTENGEKLFLSSLEEFEYNFYGKQILTKNDLITISIFKNFNKTVNLMISLELFWEATFLSFLFYFFNKNPLFSHFKGGKLFIKKFCEKLEKINKLKLQKKILEIFKPKDFFIKGKFQIDNLLSDKNIPTESQEKLILSHLESCLLQFEINQLIKKSLNSEASKNFENSENNLIRKIREWTKKKILEENVKLNYLCFLLTLFKFYKCGFAIISKQTKINKIEFNSKYEEALSILIKLDLFPLKSDKKYTRQNKSKIFENKSFKFKAIIGNTAVMLMKLYSLNFEVNFKNEEEKSKMVKASVKEQAKALLYFFIEAEDRVFESYVEKLMEIEKLIK